MSNMSKIKNYINLANPKLHQLKNFTSNNTQVKQQENNIDEIELLSTNYLDYKKVYNDGYIPQGVTKIDDKILISAYKENTKSRIYIYDEKTNQYEGILILDNQAHVGGISYDKENKILFVTGNNGQVNTYSYERIEETISNYKRLSSGKDYTIDFSNFISTDSGECFFKVKSNININVYKGMDSKAATTYYNNGRLYIGSFEGIDDGVLVSYKLSYNKETNTLITGDPLICGLPSATQGIAVTDYKGTKYLVTSQSISKTPSMVTLFEITDKGIKGIGRKYLNAFGIEGIHITDDNNIVAIFENGTNEILSTNIDELKSNLESYNYKAEISRDIYGFAYETENKFNEIKDKIKEKIENVF